MKRLAWTVSLVSMLSVPLVPSIASAQPVLVDGELRERPAGQPTPVNRVLLATAGITFGLSYVPSVVVAAASDHDGDGWLWLPVVGPWADLADRGGCGAGETSCGAEAVNKTLLVGAGLAQAAAVVQAGLAFVIPESETPLRFGKVQIVPASMGRGAGFGLGAVGVF